MEREGKCGEWTFQFATRMHRPFSTSKESEADRLENSTILLGSRGQVLVCPFKDLCLRTLQMVLNNDKYGIHEDTWGASHFSPYPVPKYLIFPSQQLLQPFLFPWSLLSFLPKHHPTNLYMPPSTFSPFFLQLLLLFSSPTYWATFFCCSSSCNLLFSLSLLPSLLWPFSFPPHLWLAETKTWKAQQYCSSWLVTPQHSHWRSWNMV